MGLGPRRLTFSGLRRGVRGEAAAMPQRQRGIAPLPVTGGNAGLPFAALAGASDQAAGQLARMHAGEQQAALAAALSRSEAVLSTKLDETAAKHEADHQGFEQAAGIVVDEWVKTLPEGLRQQAGTLGVQYIQGHKRRILGVERARQKEADKAELLGRAETSFDDAMAAARAGDGEAMGLAGAAYEGARQSLMAGGMISAERFTQMGLALVDGAERQQALQGLDVARGQGLAAAEAYIKRFEAGEEAEAIKDPDQRAKIVLEMQRDLADDRAAYRRRVAAADAAWKERFGAAKSQVDTAVKAILGGMPPAQYEEMKSELLALGQTDERWLAQHDRLESAMTLVEQNKDFAALPPATQQELYAFKAARIDSGKDLDQARAWKGILEGTAKAMREDPHGYADAHLPAPYQSPALAMGDLVGFSASLQQRWAATANLTAWNDDNPVAFLRPGEAAALRDAFQGMSPTDQALYLHAINQNAPAHAGAVYEALSKDAPALAHIGGLTALGPQHHGPAELALQGLQTEGIDLPTDADIWFGEETGTAFAAAGRSRAAVRTVADAIYRAEALRRGLTKDDADEDLYRDAVQLAMGRAQNGAGEETGGLADVNGVTVAVPPGITAAALTTFFDGLRGPGGALDLAIMSTGGSAPRDAAGNVFDPRFHPLYPVAAGGSRFYLSSTNPETDGVTYLRGSGPGGLFELDVRRAPAKGPASTLGALSNAVDELVSLAGDVTPEVDWQAAWDQTNVRLKPLDELAQQEDLVGVAARTLRSANVELADIETLAESPGLVGASARLLMAIGNNGGQPLTPEEESYLRSPITRHPYLDRQGQR